MKHSELKDYYPAGGQIDIEIHISQVTITQNPDILIGYALLTPDNDVQKIAIHQLHFDTHSEYRAIPARCPHQGADITKDPLKSDGNIYCSLHKRPICIYSEYNNAYLVKKRASKFYITKNGA